MYCIAIKPKELINKGLGSQYKCIQCQQYVILRVLLMASNGYTQEVHTFIGQKSHFSWTAGARYAVHPLHKLMI